MSLYQQTLEKKIQDRSARIAILGLGYVGLPLATIFAEAGFNVIQTGGISGLRWAYFDTDKVGGTILELYQRVQ